MQNNEKLKFENNNKYKNIFNKNISSINNKMTKKKEERKK